MKTLFAILLVALCLKASAQKDAEKIFLPLKDSIVYYEDVVQYKDTTISADKLFTLAQTWFANTFKSSKSVLQVNDRVSMKLIGKGTASYSNGVGVDAISYISYTIAVDIKNGKYRYKVYDITFGHVSGNEEDVSKGYSHYLHNEIHRALFESKKNALNRYERDFNAVGYNITNLISSLKSNMNNLDADKF